MTDEVRSPCCPYCGSRPSQVSGTHASCSNELCIVIVWNVLDDPAKLLRHIRIARDFGAST